jgi:replication-associated recombination protein RarA
MTWFNDLGYNKNPLCIRPTENNNLIGYEKIIQRIIYQLKIGNVIFLEGNYGTGKSSILRYINKTFNSNILYFNCAEQKNLKKKIMAKRPLWRKLFFLKPNKLILLIDETHLANNKDFDFLYEFYIMDRVKSIVFAGTDFKQVRFNKAFKSDTKLYKLNEIRNNLGINIINNRMPKQDLISSVLAKRVFMMCDMNPRKFLENIEDLFRSSMAQKKKVSKKEIDILQELLKKRR